MMQRFSHVSAMGVLAILLFAGCGADQVAGNHGNGSETTNGVTARIKSPDGEPARGMEVRVRRSDFTRGQIPGPMDSTARTRVDATTDALGVFAITGLKAGEYVIESGDDSAFGLAIRTSLSGDEPVKDLRDISLERYVQLLGRVNREGLKDSVAISVLIYGLDREAKCAPDGSFRIHMAPGRYSLKVVASSQEVGSLDIPQVTCLPGTETRVAELTMPIGFRADSTTVRNFLRDAGLDTLNWNRTVGVENNRIRSLNLKDLGLSTLPASIGDLVFIRALFLDGNPLKALPPEMAGLRDLHTLSLDRVRLDSLPGVISRLASLKYLRLGKTGLSVFPPALADMRTLEGLYLDSNGLTALPAAIGNLTGLYDLNLAQNKLQSLPPQIGQLERLQNLSVHDNALDSLPPEIGNLAKLRYLSLGDNRLAALPETITRLQPTGGFGLWNNRLCQVPVSIKTWIDQYDFENYGGRSGNIWAGLQLGCP